MSGLRESVESVLLELQGYVQNGALVHFEAKFGEVNVDENLSVPEIAEIHNMLPTVRFSVPMREIKNG